MIEFIEKGLPPDRIVVAACKDDCVQSLSHEVKDWFGSMGAVKIWALGYRCGYAFIGTSGKKQCSEKRSMAENEKVSLTQIFKCNLNEALEAVAEDMNYPIVQTEEGLKAYNAYKLEPCEVRQSYDEVRGERIW